MYDRQQRAVFCNYCTKHSISTVSTAASNDVFRYGLGTGFSNWKNAVARLDDHAQSVDHRAAYLRMVKEKAGPLVSIASQLDKQLAAQQSLRRQGLISHLHTLKTLLRQGIAIRGDTDLESNVHQFNLDKISHDDGLKLLVDEGHFVNSHDALQEQEQLLVLDARRSVLKDIQVKYFYAILADESTDVTKLEQLSFSIRSCDDNYDVKEDFVGIFDCCHGVSSDALMSYIKDILLRCNLDPQKVAGIGFDGASVMKCLAAKLKEVCGDHASYFHCLAHCNELIVKDAHAISPMISESLGFCQSLYAIVGAYPKRVALLEDVQKDVKNETESEDYKILRLKSLSMTRWTTRAKAANVVLSKTVELKTSLGLLAKDKSVTAEIRAKIKGILPQFTSHKKMFGLQATYELVGLLENLSVQLQCVGLTADIATFCISSASARLDEMRSDVEFRRILKRTLAIPGVIGSPAPPAAAPRSRKIPRRLDNADIVITERLTLGGATATASQEVTEVHSLKQLYFEAVDALKQSLSERFDQAGMDVVRQIESCLLSASNRKEIPVSIGALKIPFVDAVDLESELKGLPAIIGLYNATVEVRIKEVTKVSTLCDIFNAMPAAKVANPQTHKLLMLYHTMPLVTASCERSFSVMRRVKTWVRSRSGQNHLNNVMFAHIHKKAMDEINFERVASEFINLNDGRKRYFGSYSNFVDSS